MPTRPPSSSSSAIFRPWPSSPRRFPSETSQSVNVSSAEREVRSPILSSYRATRKPGNEGSTRNAVTLRELISGGRHASLEAFSVKVEPAPAEGSVFAKTTYRAASPPLVTQDFVPFRRYVLPWRLADVAIAAESEPACGSVRQKAPRISPCARRGRNFLRWASVPYFASGNAARELVTLRATAIAASTRATSSDRKSVV